MREAIRNAQKAWEYWTIANVFLFLTYIITDNSFWLTLDVVFAIVASYVADKWAEEALSICEESVED